MSLYDGSGMSEEMQGSTVTAVYSAGAEKLGSTISWMLQDGQGSTRQLINGSASVNYRTERAPGTAAIRYFVQAKPARTIQGCASRNSQRPNRRSMVR